MTMAIEAQGLVKRYGKTPALGGLDLAAERGQVVAVLGPNGAGKTTFRARGGDATAARRGIAPRRRARRR
jgi:ABC-type branched-subunit amino acid transport system ATPase component